MKRWERVLLLFSLALNISFVSIAATHFARIRDEGPPPEAESPAMMPPHGGAMGHDGSMARGGSMGHPGPMAHRFPALERWHERRHKRFAQRLQLDPAQQDAWNTRFGVLAPQIAEARMDIVTARDAYHGTLLRGDADAIRAAAHQVSQTQSRLDSLCAEAMAAEAASLRPDQRARYVRWLTQPPRFPGRSRPERDADPTAAGRDANDDRKDAP